MAKRGQDRPRVWQAMPSVSWVTPVARVHALRGRARRTVAWRRRRMAKSGQPAFMACALATQPSRCAPSPFGS